MGIGGTPECAFAFAGVGCVNVNYQGGMICIYVVVGHVCYIFDEWNYAGGH